MSGEFDCAQKMPASASHVKNPSEIIIRSTRAKLRARAVGGFGQPMLPWQFAAMVDDKLEAAIDARQPVVVIGAPVIKRTFQWHPAEKEEIMKKLRDEGLPVEEREDGSWLIDCDVTVVIEAK